MAGIIDEGVDLFDRALQHNPSATLLLFGTRTTIESGEHVRRLTSGGSSRAASATAACHGLAAVIDKDPDDPALPGLVDACVSRALVDGRPPGKLYAGLACTHYAFVADLFRDRSPGSPAAGTEILDPNGHMIDALTAEGPGEPPAPGPVLSVEVVSKVELPEAQRRAVARRLEPVSPLTAQALMNYTCIPALF